MAQHVWATTAARRTGVRPGQHSSMGQQQGERPGCGMQHLHDTQEQLLSLVVCPQGQQGGFGGQVAGGAQGQLQLVTWCAPCMLVGLSALALCQPAVQPVETCVCVRAGGVQVVAWCLASAHRAAPHLAAGDQQEERQAGVLGAGR